MLSERKLELEVLTARKRALELDGESKCWQHNNSMELDMRLTDEHVFALTMMERNRELADLDLRLQRNGWKSSSFKGWQIAPGKECCG